MDQMKKLLTLILLLIAGDRIYSQEKIIKGSLFEGIAVAGFVDQGVYFNCTGPAVKYIFAPKSCLLLGLLPSLKLKQDKVESGKPKNSWITPSLGFGLTVVFRHIAIQLPAFYTAKTSAADGKWRLGVGMGYKF